MKYIALLRGINVGGQKKIKMAELRLLLNTNGFENVQTYIQSGNVIFDSTESAKFLEEQIHTIIYIEYDFEVPVIIKTPKELLSAVKNNPFLKNTEETKKLYFTFLNKLPLPENSLKLHSLNFSPDEYVLEDKVLYSYYANGAGRSKMTNNIFESKLNVTATSRNWNTVNKLISLSTLA